MKKIIIQETDPNVLDVLTQALELENYDVYALQKTDQDFLELIDKTRPHVVMLDYRLTGKECLEIFATIRKTYPHLPLIALSCNHNINTVAMEVGFDDYIPKPFDLDQLYQTLRKYIPDPAAEIKATV
jgi:DNA-binding response OmpR family regulator